MKAFSRAAAADLASSFLLCILLCCKITGLLLSLLSSSWVCRDCRKQLRDSSKAQVKIKKIDIELTEKVTLKLLINH